MEKNQSNPIFFQAAPYDPTKVNNGPGANIGNAMAVDLGGPNGELWVKRQDGTSFKIGGGTGAAGAPLVARFLTTFTQAVVGDGSYNFPSDAVVPSDFVAIGAGYRFVSDPIIGAPLGQMDVIFRDSFGNIHFAASIKDIGDTADPAAVASGFQFVAPVSGGLTYPYSYAQTGVPVTVANQGWITSLAFSLPGGSGTVSMDVFLVGFRRSDLAII